MTNRRIIVLVGETGAHRAECISGAKRAQSKQYEDSRRHEKATQFGKKAVTAVDAVRATERSVGRRCWLG